MYFHTRSIFIGFYLNIRIYSVQTLRSTSWLQAINFMKENICSRVTHDELNSCTGENWIGVLLILWTSMKPKSMALQVANVCTCLNSANEDEECEWQKKKKPSLN